MLYNLESKYIGENPTDRMVGDATKLTAFLRGLIKADEKVWQLACVDKGKVKSSSEEYYLTVYQIETVN